VAFESGEKYTAMKSAFTVQLSAKDREIRSLKSELADAHAQLVTMRNRWMQVFDDVEKEHAKALEKKDRKIKACEERALKAEQQRDDFRGRLKEKSRELYEAKTALEEEQGKVSNLKAQISRDHENSSKSSSMSPNRKKITNNREPSGKRPGGQPGHEWHPRKKYVPTSRVELPAPKEYADSSDYKLTGKTITKQLVDMRVELIVTEYTTAEYRHIRTGERVHAEFPRGLVLDVTYGGSIKAFAFLLNNYCNVSIGKVSGFLSELTNGELNISTGMINGLAREFSRKTEAEQKKTFADMLLCPVMHVDFTSARVNGKKVNVAVCATPFHVLYFARERKGHEGIRGTPVEVSRQTFVHDHDLTYYAYGDAHQECLDHVLRYLKDSIANEAKLKWHRQMQALLREMIHFRNGLDPGDDRDPDKIDPERVSELEARYDEILQLARDEYDYEPPSKYYRNGFNLYRRLFEYRSAHLLFLHDRRVPHSNSLAERLLRIYKRKQHQVMAFRSLGGLEELCNALGTIATLRSRGKSLYGSIVAIFDTMVDNSVDAVS
jgi:hypothetical protein